MPSTACWSWDARTMSASPDPGRGWGYAPTSLIPAPRPLVSVSGSVPAKTRGRGAPCGGRRDGLKRAFGLDDLASKRYLVR